jgi:protein TonB
VVQEISKAEILVAYGQVNQAISMLRNVLRDHADSIDVHIKLKDIYLRTGMMIEAATECRELERIHEARGESDRARDYAIRAGRLTQLIEHPSGDLFEPERKPSEEVERRANPAPLRIAEPQSAAPKTRPAASRLDERPAQARRMTISVIPADAPAVVEAATTRPPDLLQASHSSPVEVLPPVAEAPLDAGLSCVSAPGQTALACVDISTRNLPELFASSLPVEKKRSRLTAAAVAAAAFVLLGVSAVIGGFAYDAHLERQYQALALATPPLAAPSPPLALVPEESEPVPENEPITVVVTPGVQTDAPAERQRFGPEVRKNEPPVAAPPQPVSEPPKVTTRPSPILPRTASPDSHTGTDNGTPLGIPVDVPIGATHPAEPPPKAVRRSPGVVTGSAVKRVDPVYPPAAREARLTGVVAVEVTVSEQGNVTSARALSGPTLLQNAAVSAARAWKFKASTLGGVPVTTTTTIIFNFKL